ncbi:MAG TPA: two-component regulator propeller domain-containing protein [Longimicrobium sp.]|nr:two-component regulator propeller domain-containing protein [Longimicrobium sp.]
MPDATPLAARIRLACGIPSPRTAPQSARGVAGGGAAPRRCLALLAAACLAAGGAADARAQVPEMAFASWGTEQGLPSNIALDVAQTPDGYLWLASYEGIVRFDGVAFRVFNESDIPGMDRASFWRVVVDSAGALWGASEYGGLVRHAGGRWTVFRTRDGLKSDKVTALLPDTGGVLWVGTRGGVSRVRNGRIEPLPAPAGMAEPSVTDLARDPGGNLWIGTVADGVVRYRDGRYERLGTRPGDQVTSLHADAGGAVWIGTFDSGVTRLRGGEARRLAGEGPGAPRRVNSILRDREGTLWLAAENGLFRMEGERAVPVPLPGGRPITQASGLHRDQEGNLWVGSRQGGLFRLRPTAVAALTRADGLPHDIVFAIEGDGAGGVWIGTQGGVAHRTPGGTRLYTQAGGALADNVTRDLLRSRAGDLWAATNGGLTRIRGGRATTFGARDGLPDDRVRALFEAADGTLWIATYNGLAALRDGRFQSYGAAQGLPDPYILSVFQDRRGTVWVGTQSEGLFRMAGGRFVPGPRELARQPVFRMMEDADGTLWVGSARGLARIRGDGVFLFTTRHGLAGSSVYQALDDGRGRLWLTGSWGVGHVPRAELEAVAAGRARTVTMKQFGSRDGMAGEASSISRAWRGPDGRLWFGTPAGVAVVDPARLRRNARAPVPIIERVVVDDEVHEGEGSIEVVPGNRRLELHFTAASFVAPEQLRFRYRLEGYDPGWVEGGTRRVAFYTNLPPGRYVFHVQARNEDGVASTHVPRVTLRLRPYYWQTWWFALLVGAAALAAALAAHRLRVRMAQQAVREEMLRDLSLQDDLTGLYNRRGLLALAEQLVREGERSRRGFDVVFVDLDGLKRINDTLGHPEGDRAIRDAAQVIRASFRDSDVVARLGGDEFAVLVRNDPAHGGDPGAAVEAATARLREAVARHNATAGRPYELSLSLGFSGYDPAAPQPIESLLDAADQQMYAHKRAKRLARA